MRGGARRGDGPGVVADGAAAVDGAGREGRLRRAAAGRAAARRLAADEPSAAGLRRVRLGSGPRASELAWRVDGLAALMLLMITGVGCAGLRLRRRLPRRPPRPAPPATCC
ncbi:MAG: hypothetical protein MZW92_81010 [Comamonadaceae bacterium]|nr:hypothetical protein [Comamonadaceae bacterium]